MNTCVVCHAQGTSHKELGVSHVPGRDTSRLEQIGTGIHIYFFDLTGENRIPNNDL